jgi:quercetin dioxygenase-like cupin family protein
MPSAFSSGLSPDDPFAVLADAARTGGALGVVVSTWPAGREPPPHSMPGSDQAFVVLAGQCVLTIDDRSFPAEPGDLVFAPGGSRVEVRVADESCRVLCILVPAGPEAYLATASALPAINPATLLALAADHGVRLHPS